MRIRLPITLWKTWEDICAMHFKAERQYEHDVTIKDVEFEQSKRDNVDGEGDAEAYLCDEKDSFWEGISLMGNDYYFIWVFF